MSTGTLRPARLRTPCRPPRAAPFRRLARGCALAAALSLGGCAGDAAARAPAAASPAADRWGPPVRTPAWTGAPDPAEPQRMVDLATGSGGAHALLTTGPFGEAATALYHARLDGGAVTRLSAGPVWFARLAVDGAGNPHALWYEAQGAERRASVLLHRAWDGRGWGPARVVRREAGGRGVPIPSLSAAFGCDGALHVAYTTGTALEHRTWTAAGGWGEPFALAPMGGTPALSRAPCPGALHVAWMGTGDAPGPGARVNTLFVRTLRDGRWESTSRLFGQPGRYSHLPLLMADGAGVLHAVWLQDTDGTPMPEALYHATSRDGAAWSPARDVTPPGVAGALLWGVRGMVDGAGRPRLAIRFSRPERPDFGELRTTRWEGGAWSPPAPLAVGEPLGEGDLLLAPWGAAGAVVAWRNADGGYRSAVDGAARGR